MDCIKFGRFNLQTLSLSITFLSQLLTGIIEDEKSVIEIKCFPSLARSSVTVEQAAKEKKGFPVIFEDNNLTMNKKHHYYNQVNNIH